MSKFMSDATDAINTIQAMANCSDPTAPGASGASCVPVFNGQTVIQKVETWASSVQDPYRSRSCDYKLYYPLEQILQTEKDYVRNMIPSGYSGPITQSQLDARNAQLTAAANAAISNYLSQAQLVVSTCQ